MTKMNPEIKQKWLNALRSGEYSQGTETLRKGESYCCLGVLCDLYLKETNTEDCMWTNKLTSNPEIYFFAYQYDKGWINDYLPEVVYSWAELDTDNPEIVYEDCIMSISDINDEGASFDVIANVIEEQL